LSPFAEDEVVHHHDITSLLIVGTRRAITGDDLDLGDPRVIERTPAEDSSARSEQAVTLR
jgi:hypothetical protein